MDYSLWGRKELDMTYGLSTAHSIQVQVRVSPGVHRQHQSHTLSLILPSILYPWYFVVPWDPTKSQKTVALVIPLFCTCYINTCVWSQAGENRKKKKEGSWLHPLGSTTLLNRKVFPSLSILVPKGFQCHCCLQEHRIALCLGQERMEIKKPKAYGKWGTLYCLRAWGIHFPFPESRRTTEALPTPLR